MLSGEWQSDLDNAITARFSGGRVVAMGRPTISRNLLKTVAVQTSALYDRSVLATCEDAPAGQGDEPGPCETFAEALTEAGVWAQAQRHQLWTTTVRQGVRRVDWTGDPPTVLRVRNVQTSMVYAEFPPDEPRQPHLVYEAIPRERVVDAVTGKRKAVWTWDVIDMRDPTNPQYRILLARNGKHEQAVEVTQEFLGGASNDAWSGPGYPFRFADDKPFMPYVWFHAADTGHSWDPWDMCEVVEGAMDVAGLWTFWMHGVKDAAWPQRYSVNAILRGLSAGGEGYGEHRSVEADPTSILQFMTDDALGSSQIGQWQAGIDPERLEVAVASFERALMASFGLGSADLERASGGAESGYALTIRRSSQRELQRRQAPQYARSDRLLVERCAAVWNRFQMGDAVPEDGWSVSYPSLPLGPEERKEVADKVAALKGMGITPSKVWVVEQLEQVEPGQALALLERWLTDDDALSTPDEPPKPPPVANNDGDEDGT